MLAGWLARPSERKPFLIHAAWRLGMCPGLRIAGGVVQYLHSTCADSGESVKRWGHGCGRDEMHIIEVCNDVHCTHRDPSQGKYSEKLGAWLQLYLDRSPHTDVFERYGLNYLAHSYSLAHELDTRRTPRRIILCFGPIPDPYQSFTSSGSIRPSDSQDL